MSDIELGAATERATAPADLQLSGK